MTDLPFKLILGSGSPRRKQLLEQLGFSFEVRVSDADESAPSYLTPGQTVEWVADSKAAALLPELAENEVLLTADTEVWQGNHRFGKPATPEEASDMLRRLSGTTHNVISGFCVCSKIRKETHHVTTRVVFRTLSEEDIEYYVSTCKPFDKAGAYGIQEWIGLIGIERLEGSYHNVVGLPTAEVREVLRNW